VSPADEHREPECHAWAGELVGALLVSGLAGSVLLSLLTHVYYIVVRDPGLRDGQYILFVFGTASIGWYVGVMAACLLLRRRFPEPPAWKVYTILVGAVLVGWLLELPLGALSALAVALFPIKY
jgi:hypothetical protein